MTKAILNHDFAELYEDLKIAITAYTSQKKKKKKTLKSDVDSREAAFDAVTKDMSSIFNSSLAPTLPSRNRAIPVKAIVPFRQLHAAISKKLLDAPNEEFSDELDSAFRHALKALSPGTDSKYKEISNSSSQVEQEEESSEEEDEDEDEDEADNSLFVKDKGKGKATKQPHTHLTRKLVRDWHDGNLASAIAAREMQEEIMGHGDEDDEADPRSDEEDDEIDPTSEGEQDEVGPESDEGDEVDSDSGDDE